MTSWIRMTTLAFVFGAFGGGCGRPEVGRADGGTSDAAVQPEISVADAGPCTQKPTSPWLPICRDGCSYLCGEQCADICGARGCWSCVDGMWRQEAVDCQTGCP
jgi:hypothetical protein